MNSKQFTGLTNEEAKKKLIQDGFNEIPSEKKKSIWHFIYEVIKEPMVLLLLISASIYFFFGDTIEGSMLLFFILFVMGITIYQEQRTEKSIDALRNLSSPRALVIREGQTIRVAGREVVVDDLIVLAEGDRVPADAILLEAVNLSVDESLLTGESVPVTKIENENLELEKKPGGDNLPYIFSGTLVVRGHGIAKVIETGTNTEIGKIGKALNSLIVEKTLVQKEISVAIRNVAAIAISLSVILFVIYGLSRHNWLEAVLAAITMAMSILPEEFPIILTIFLAVGAWRLTQKKVLARRSAVIETLGSASVLCVDKTGTLTENKMKISHIFTNSHSFDINKTKDGSFHEVIRYGIYASQIKPFDPMETAFIEAGQNHLPTFEQIYDNLNLEKEYPLEKTSLCIIHAWKKTNQNYLIAAKGSPEAIIHLCKLPKEKHAAIYKEIDTLAKEGLRVLAVAKGSEELKKLPENRNDINYEFLGLVGLADPIRDEAAQAIDVCKTAGIRVIMITGDYPETALNIGRKIGLDNNTQTITGNQLEKMSAQELREKIKTINIFSRVIPEQKLLIVNALKKNGEIVAMTGDGVNDAPALKSAHIGIAMGEHGTDVAREASSIVLLDDNFSSIVNGIRLGRRIYNNLTKAISYTVAVHVPIAGLSILPVLFGWPLILLPAHIVFLELIIDPACTVAFETETEEENIMRKKPRKINEPIFNRKIITISLIQGLSVLLVNLIAFKLADFWDFSPDKTRTLVFASLMFSNLFLLATNLSWDMSILKHFKKQNKPFKFISLGATAFLALAIFTPFLQELFKFKPLSAKEIVICLALGLLSIVWFEIYKFIINKKKK